MNQFVDDDVNDDFSKLNIDEKTIYNQPRANENDRNKNFQRGFNSNFNKQYDDYGNRNNRGRWNNSRYQKNYRNYGSNSSNDKPINHGFDEAHKFSVNKYKNNYRDNRNNNDSRGFDQRPNNHISSNEPVMTPEDPELERELFTNENVGINFGKYDDIPVKISGNNVPKPLDDFESIQLGPILNNNIRLCKYTIPTPVQKYAIPTLKSGRDIMACAQTGSGKTASFLIPILYKLSMLPEMINRYKRKRGPQNPFALVLAPTRELAIQIYEEARKVTYRSQVKPVVIYGGASQYDQSRQLSEGADLIIATPGRLIDFINRHKIYLNRIKCLCLDEADRMLDMGFEPQIREIIEASQMPGTGMRQTMMFSATFPKEIQEMASRYLNDYVYLTVGRVGSTTDNIKQELVWVEDENKLEKLMEYLPSAKDKELMLVFVEMKRGADFLEYTLFKRKYPVVALHGDKCQAERELALRKFKSGQFPVMIATAVAARGLDIPNVRYVINYDLPSDIQEYVHRIGRTGRVGNLGTAISFFNKKNGNIADGLTKLLNENNQELPMWISDVVDSNRFKAGFKNRKYQNSRFGNNDFRKQNGNNNINSNNGWNRNPSVSWWNNE
ncbi:hypothetical protein A3Q56_01773 [Intoshia linei]|uniref:RNA helicase n=1 Tax=Intoshia linei TaxID=1819745 RepID=A0A177B893_9BILA|nr:hypothetical protein A3Q56_01773 [Intoshia linei]